MAILEVGAGKQFYSIQKAIDNAAANDEIYIYGGVYNEYIVCEKKLVLKGFPDDKENFSSYPIIYNSANIGHCFFCECIIQNIIFIADLNLELSDLYTLNSFVLQDSQVQNLMSKYLRYSDDETTLKEKYLVVIDSSCRFENCIFFGSLKNGVTIVQEKSKLLAEFIHCGFYFNSYCGIFVNCKKTENKIVIKDCVLRFNQTAMAICNKANVAIDNTTIQNNTVQNIAMSEESQILVNESLISY